MGVGDVSQARPICDQEDWGIVFELLALTFAGVVVLVIVFCAGVTWESYRCDERRRQIQADEISRRGFEL